MTRFIGLVLLAIGLVDGSSDTTRFEISLPKILKNSTIYHRDALFGTPFSTPTLVGRMKYVTKGDHDGCSDYEVDMSNEDFQGNFFFVIDRGECTFTSKVRKAQTKGASGVIIVDSNCHELNQGLIKQNNLENKLECAGHPYEQILPYMASDHTVQDITIPAFIITKYDGQKIKDCLEMIDSSNYDPLVLKKSDCDIDNRVIGKMLLNLPAGKENVDWELWLSSDQFPADMEHIGMVATGLKSKTTFKPRYTFLKGEDIGCKSASSPQDICNEVCIFSDNKVDSVCSLGQGYIDLNGNDYEVPGSEIVLENIRQICVFKEIEQSKNYQVYFDYVHLYQKHCEIITQNKKKCAESNIFPKLSVDASKVNSCVEQERKTLAFSKREVHDAMEKQIFTATFTVNGAALSFGLSPLFIAREICQSFKSSPSMCNCVPSSNDKQALEKCMRSKCFDEPDTPYYCDSKDTCVKTEDQCTVSTMSGSAIFMIVVAVSTPLAVFAYFYYKRAKRQMQEEVRDILSEYMPLEELSSLNNGASRDHDTVGVI